MIENKIRKIPGRSIEHFSDYLVALILLISGLKYIYKFWNFFDVGLYDESTYLFSGVDLLEYGLPDVQFAPLYSIWYFLLSFIQSDRVYLYYLNFGLVSLLVPLFLYFVLRKHNVSQLVALIFSFLFLISRGNILTWPKVSHFALLVILIPFLLLPNQKNEEDQVLLMLIGSFAAAYVRPEFFLAFICFALIFILKKAFIWKNPNWKRLMPVLSIFLIVIFTIGWPLKGGRSYVAFGQHFSLNWVAWENSNLDPWLNWQEIIEQNFGNKTSLLEMSLFRPDLVFKHIKANFSLGFLKFIFLFSSHANILLPPQFRNIETFLETSLILTGLLLAILLFVRDWKKSPQIIRGKISKYKVSILGFSIFGFITLLSIIMIYPRDHYLIMALIFLWIPLLILIFGNSEQKQTINSHWNIILIGSILIFITPHVSFFTGNEVPRPVVDTINHIKLLGIEEEVNIFEIDGGYHYYLGNNFHVTHAPTQYPNCISLIEKENISLVIISERFINYVDLLYDEGCNQLLNNFKEYGFQKQFILDGEREILVLNDLID